MSELIKHTGGPVDTAAPWSDDVLKRSELAQQLTAALSTVTQPFVLGLHGEFGNGKTFFIRRWQQELLNAGDVAVYFNAWKTDYAPEPLIAFTAAIKKQLKGHKLTEDDDAGNALATSAGRIVARSVLPRLASLVTGGLVQASDVSALTAIADDAAGAASDITDQALEDAVGHHEEAQDEVGRFQSILANCAEAITKRETGAVRKLIIFVDELDRCRPDYAIHVLECIKHFFSVDNVIFAIALDRDALNASIRAVYGDGINVNGYLRKFFDYHIELGAPDDERFTVMLARSLRLEEAAPREHTELIKIHSDLCSVFKLSLRDREQIMSEANFILRHPKSQSHWFIRHLVLILLCVRAKSPELFDRLSTSQPDIEQLSSGVERLVHDENKNDDINGTIRHSIILLAAGFVSPDAMRLQHKRGEEQKKSQQDITADPLASIAEQAITIVQQRHGLLLGPEAVRRIRFLTA